MKLDLREDKYGKTKGIKNIRKASDEVLRDTIDTNSKSKEPARAELERRKRTAADDEKQGEETPVEEPAEKEAEKPAEKEAEKPAEKEAEKPAEKPAEKDAEKPAEEPEETPDEEPKDEPEEPESDSTDSEDDEDSDDPKGERAVEKAKQNELKRIDSVKKAKQAINDLKSIVKLKNLEKEDEDNLKNKVIEILKIKASTVFAFNPNDESVRAKIAEKIKQDMQDEINEAEAKANDLETLLKKYEKPKHFQIAKAILKRKGIEDPAEFISKSKSEREKIMTEIQNAIDEDEGKGKSKKIQTERYRGIHGALKAIQENTGSRKDYASMRTILNRMYGGH
jgi:hypothetical protein